MKDKVDVLSIDLNKVETGLIQNHYKQSQNLELLKQLNQELINIENKIKLGTFNPDSFVSLEGGRNRLTIKGKGNPNNIHGHANVHIS